MQNIKKLNDRTNAQGLYKDVVGILQECSARIGGKLLVQ